MRRSVTRFGLRDWSARGGAPDWHRPTVGGEDGVEQGETAGIAPEERDGVAIDVRHHQLGALAPGGDFLLVGSDNDFITQRGMMAGKAYADASGADVDTLVLAYRVILPAAKN